MNSIVMKISRITKIYAKAMVFVLVIASGFQLSKAQPFMDNSENGFQGWIGLIARNQDNGYEQDSYIFINSEATVGYDQSLDALFVKGEGPVFYSVADGEELSSNNIPALTDNLQIPFVFIPESSSDYQIEIAGLEWIDSQVFMYDNVTKLDHNFSSEPIYRFSVQSGADSVRFLFHFQTQGIEKESRKNTFNAFYANGYLHYSFLENDNLLIIHDLNGQQVLEFHPQPGIQASMPLDLKNGIYILRLVSGQVNSYRKILVRN
jgi:hypothetical protein